MLSIGEVSKLYRISSYTLRYWEKEFDGILNPNRTKGGQRRYSKKCLRTVDEIKRLLKEELYSIKGAKKILLNRKRNRRQNKDIMFKIMQL